LKIVAVAVTPQVTPVSHPANRQHKVPSRASRRASRRSACRPLLAGPAPVPIWWCDGPRSAHAGDPAVQSAI